MSTPLIKFRYFKLHHNPIEEVASATSSTQDICKNASNALNASDMEPVANLLNDFDMEPEADSNNISDTPVDTLVNATHQTDPYDTFTTTPLKTCTSVDDLIMCLTDNGHQLPSKDCEFGSGIFELDSSQKVSKFKETGSLALAGMCLKIFGHKALCVRHKKTGQLTINPNRLSLAMVTLFGKRIHQHMPYKDVLQKFVMDDKSIKLVHDDANLSKINVPQKANQTAINAAMNANLPTALAEIVHPYLKHNKLLNEDAPDRTTKILEKGTPLFKTKIDKAGVIEKSVTWQIAETSRNSRSRYISKNKVPDALIPLPINFTEVISETALLHHQEKNTFRSHMYLLGSQNHDISDKKSEGRLIDTIMQRISNDIRSPEMPPSDNKQTIHCCDLRLLGGLYDATKYAKHCKRLAKGAKAANIAYTPVHLETHHWLLEKIFGRFLVNLLLSRTLDKRKKNNPFLNKLDSVLSNCNYIVNGVNYQPAMEGLKKLIVDKNKMSNNIPIATLFRILSSAANSIPDNQDKFSLIMGCKSAKDRTGSVLTGMEMLEPLILQRLAENKDISSLIPNGRSISRRSLTTREASTLKTCFFPQMLVAGNRTHLGSPENFNTLPLISFFRGVK